MIKPIQDYRTLIFDCDGVLLNSNKIKTQAFYRSAIEYGKHAADALVEYHLANGGVSRYEKFRFLLEDILHVENPLPHMEKLLSSYSAMVRDGLLSCDIAGDLETLRIMTKESKWTVVSGGDQNELRQIFTKRDISHFFNGGIFGSPDTKETILESEIRSGNIRSPAIFFGDSEYDYVAASKSQINFVFVSAWSESSYAFPDADLKIERLSDLI